MNTTSLKHLLDACFLAKRIVETLPELPKNMKPRHIHVLDAVGELCEQQGMCRVSDVSGRLGITMPSVTKLIQELERMELLEKYPDEQDKRITLLCLTAAGRECVRRHVVEFHSEWAEELDNITDEQAEQVISVMEQLWRTMPQRPKH